MFFPRLDCHQTWYAFLLPVRATFPRRSQSPWLYHPWNICLGYTLGSSSLHTFLQCSAPSSEWLLHTSVSIYGVTHRAYAWFMAAADKKMRTALFWVVTQQAVVISYWRFGTAYRSHLQGPKSVAIYCRRFETTVGPIFNPWR